MDPLLGLIWLLLKIIRLKFDNITPHDHGICANLEDAQKMASRSVVYSCTKLFIILHYMLTQRGYQKDVLLVSGSNLFIIYGVLSP